MKDLEEDNFSATAPVLYSINIDLEENMSRYERVVTLVCEHGCGCEHGLLFGGCLNREEEFFFFKDQQSDEKVQFSSNILFFMSSFQILKITSEQHGDK